MQPHGMGVLTGFPGKPIPGEPGFPGGPGSPASPSGPTRPGSPWKAREGVSVGGTAGCPHLPAPRFPTYLLALRTHHANLTGPALPGGEQGVKAPYVQRRARHGVGWSGGRTPLPGGCPGGCPVTARHYSHHVPGVPACPAVPRHPSRPSGPVGQMDVTHAITHGLAPAAPGTSAAIPGPTGQLFPLQRQDPQAGWTYLLPVGAGCPREPLRGNSRAKWVPTGGLMQGFPPVCTTAPFIPPPPTELSPRGRIPAPQPGVHMRCSGGGHTHRCVPVPRPHPPSITYHLSTLPLLALRPLGALRRRRRRKEWGEGRQQSQGRGVHGGFGGGLTCMGPPGWVRMQSAPCGKRGGSSGVLPAPATAEDWGGRGG